MPAKIPFGIQTYRRADLPQVRLTNLFAETVPTGKDKVTLLPRPSLAVLCQLGDGPINGLLQETGAVSGQLVTVSGKQVYTDNTYIGDTDALGAVQMTGADGAVLIVTGTALYRLTTTVVGAVTFPDGAGVISVAYLGGFALAARANSRRIYFTLDAKVWDGLDYFAAEQSTDYVVCIMVIGDQLWVFCARHTEIFYATGDGDAPFQRVQGRLFDKGAISRDSVVRFDNSVVWVGSDGVVYRGDSQPVRISDHGIEERIADADPGVIEAWAFPWFGHLFYVLRLGEFSCAYDPATGQWHELASRLLPQWRARLGIQGEVGAIAGDSESGRVFKLLDGVQDFDQPVVREFTAILPRGIIDNLTVDISVAETAGALLEMKTSRDNGRTWSDWRQAQIGGIGKTRRRAMYRRLGLSDQDGMICWFRMTDPALSRVSSVVVNDNGGGHSR